jgi:hypothetical protein
VHLSRARTVRQQDGASEATSPGPGLEHAWQPSVSTGPAAGSMHVSKKAVGADPPSHSSVRDLLRLVAPPHAAGYWVKPDLVQQQELRRTYQGKCLLGASRKGHAKRPRTVNPQTMHLLPSAMSIACSTASTPTFRLPPPTRRQAQHPAPGVQPDSPSAQWQGTGWWSQKRRWVACCWWPC